MPVTLLAVSVTALLGEPWEVPLFVSAFLSRLQHLQRLRKGEGPGKAE